ncbi:MAG TPA: single-stranded-DNA-specific exonuclease RecJ [Phycisphaerae bacterium]|nr:single-stranded-DNA-specific exonuclease RecJ [Phycisphaerae bacterium]
MPRDWVIAAPWHDRDGLAQRLGTSPIVAQVLYNRGLTDESASRQFLAPQMTDILPPEAIPATLEAADRIAAAISAGRKIVLYGDYDVDGITGVSILWHCLKLAGANVDFYIPRRLEEGYGVNSEAIDTIANDGAGMIVTVDCGVTALEPAEKAKRRGVEFIITDHHEPHRAADGTAIVPEAVVVHPTVWKTGPSNYANPHLSGAGVALKLAWAVAQKLSNSQKVRPEFRDFLIDAVGLAALGTIADVVPLIGENRVIAHYGLRGLAQSRIPGVRALIATAKLSGKSLSGYDIGFKLAPRLNAIGRMGHAQIAVELLTRASDQEAVLIAQNLEKQNGDRQRLQSRIAKDAREMVISQRQNDDTIRGIVLHSAGWHAGVIGIVASKVTEEFGRPAVMIATENGVGQGSGRSVCNFALHEAFAHCGQHLISYGGHARAAGLKVETAKVADFTAAFQERAGKLLTPADLRPKLTLDDEIGLDDLCPELVTAFERLEPFGAGNTTPRLASGWLELYGEPRAVGTNKSHLQVTLTDGRHRCKGIAFGMAASAASLQDHRRCRVAFEPIINEWQGRRTAEMQIIDFQFPA